MSTSYGVSEVAADHPQVSERRFLIDRRRGVDRRAIPRRDSVTSVQVERRRSADRRRGPERRSTLERRNRRSRRVSVETDSEHVKNALQLLTQVANEPLTEDGRAILDAARARLRLALSVNQPRGT